MRLISLETLLAVASSQLIFFFPCTSGFAVHLQTSLHVPQFLSTNSISRHVSFVLLAAAADTSMPEYRSRSKRFESIDRYIDETDGTANAAIQEPKLSDYLRDPTDYRIMRDRNEVPITIDRMLATKPLQGDCMTRPGPGGRELTYMSGDAVTRNLNMIFGYNQWNLHIIKSEKTVCIEVDNPRASGMKLWHVSYSAHVRITHLPSGCYREDIGCGDVLDRSLVVADQNAVKASITDAMKRTARHFGDKLGNSLYDSDFSIKSAPRSLQDALNLYERERNV